MLKNATAKNVNERNAEGYTGLTLLRRLSGKPMSMKHIIVHTNVNRAICVDWCRSAESNRGPTDYESVALPTELPRQIRFLEYRRL